MLVAAIGMKAADQVTAKVSGTTLNIGLTNETTYCAFQMDITLPTGVDATAFDAVANRLGQEGSSTEIGGTKFIVASNKIDAGTNTYRVIAYNLANAQIANATGDLLKVTLSAAVADPTKVKVTNIKFVAKSDLSESPLADATGENGVTIGDINKSGGKPNLNDVICLVEILQYGESDPRVASYDLKAADVNQSGGAITLNDLIALIAII